MYKEFVQLVRDMYQSKEFIPLHEPKFIGNEKKYLIDTIDSSFVSSVGEYVDKFEQKVAEYTGSKYAVATVNGTAALHISLLLAGVEANDEVLTQSLTFVATCNAIRYCGAQPVFLDIDKTTLGLSPDSIEEFLSKNTAIDNDGQCINRATGNVIRACVPMHTFGHPVKINRIKTICQKYQISLVEDAAESLGSYRDEVHTGTVGTVAALSFNGNKIITTGGGGMILTSDESIAVRAKHLTTTAKSDHQWEYNHTETGFNYRLPNLNAALGLAQMEQLPDLLSSKRKVANIYKDWCNTLGVEFITEPKQCKSNYWLNTLLLKNRQQRDEFLEYTNASGIMTRPVWTPMHQLEMNQEFTVHNMRNTSLYSDRLVNIPSSPIL